MSADSLTLLVGFALALLVAWVHRLQSQLQTLQVEYALLEAIWRADRFSFDGGSDRLVCEHCQRRQAEDEPDDAWSSDAEQPIWFCPDCSVLMPRVSDGDTEVF